MEMHCSICGKTAGLLPFKQGYICRHCREELRKWPLSMPEKPDRTTGGAKMTPFCRDPRQQL